MNKLRVLDLFHDGTKVFFDAKGYALVWREKKSKKVHVLEWEKHNGPKPPGYEIHHVNENKSDWAIGNLELLSNSDHQRIHAGWIRENGAWVKKPCTTCKLVLPFSEFYPRKGHTPSARCKSCHCVATRQWALENPEKRKKIGLKYYYKNRSLGLSEIGGQNA